MNDSSDFDLKCLDESQSIIGERFKAARPQASLVLGTGWSLPIGTFEVLDTLSFADIPALGATSVSGHVGRLVWGAVQDREFFIFDGRRHWYELSRFDGLTSLAAIPYLTKHSGAKALILTQGVGGITFGPKTFMVVSDHICPESLNIFPGPPLPIWRDEFAVCTRLYDSELQTVLKQALISSSQEPKSGVYRLWPGKQFQTPCETQMIKSEGANVVGKSLVFEAVYGYQLGLKVGAVCLVTNYAAGLDAQGPDHLLHKQVGKEMEPATREIIREILCRL